MRQLATMLLFAAVLGSPMTLRADHDDHRDRDHDKRYYDADRHDYHDWNEPEEQAYRHYLEERHREYRDYGRLNKKEQREYWKWRHEHADADDRR